jgi:hypothetical protein
LNPEEQKIWLMVGNLGKITYFLFWQQPKKTNVELLYLKELVADRKLNAGLVVH